MRQQGGRVGRPKWDVGPQTHYFGVRPCGKPPHVGNDSMEKPPTATQTSIRLARLGSLTEDTGEQLLSAHARSAKTTCKHACVSDESCSAAQAPEMVAYGRRVCRVPGTCACGTSLTPRVEPPCDAMLKSRFRTQDPHLSSRDGQCGQARRQKKPPVQLELNGMRQAASEHL